MEMFKHAADVREAHLCMPFNDASYSGTVSLCCIQGNLLMFCYLERHAAIHYVHNNGAETIINMYK